MLWLLSVQLDDFEGFILCCGDDLVIPEIHCQEHVRRATDIDRSLVVVNVEDVNVSIVTGGDQIVFVKLDANCSRATRT